MPPPRPGDSADVEMMADVIATWHFFYRARLGRLTGDPIGNSLEGEEEGNKKCL